MSEEIAVSDFEFPEKIIRLNFKGTELEGLIIDTSTVSVEGLMAMQEKSLQVEELRREATTDTAKNRIMMVEFQAMIELFANVVVSWNVKKKGEPVEPTAANLMRQPPDYLMAIIQIWITAAGGVDADLKPDSLIGNTSEEVLIPMEVL